MIRKNINDDINNFNYLCQKNIIEINPTQNLETPKIGKRLPKYLTLDDSKKLLDIAKAQGITIKDLEKIRDDVKNAAYEIIEKKQATYYGIGVALTRLIKAILNDEEVILTVSAFLNGEYNEKNIYIGVPAVITNKGVREILELPLAEEEQEKLSNSCHVIRDIIEKLDM